MVNISRVFQAAAFFYVYLYFSEKYVQSVRLSDRASGFLRSQMQPSIDKLQQYQLLNPNHAKSFRLTSGNCGFPSVANAYGAIESYAQIMLGNNDQYLDDLVFNNLVRNILPQFSVPGGEKIVRSKMARYLNNSFHIGDNSFGEDDLVLTNGAKEALDLIFRSITNPGDKVFVRNRSWGSYKYQITNNGADVVLLESTGDNNSLSAKDLENAILDHGVPKAVILSLVENPDGAMITQENLEELFCFLSSKDLQDTFLILDASYNKFLLDDRDFDLSNIMAKNGFDEDKLSIVFGTGKYALLDHSIRMGGVVTKFDDLVSAIKNQISQTNTHVNIISQIALYGALSDPNRDIHINSYIKGSKLKLKLFDKLISEIDGIRQLAVNGGYAYIEVDEDFLDRVDQVLGYDKVESLFLKIAAIEGVGGKAFCDGDHNCIRINLAQLTFTEIEKIAENIKLGFEFLDEITVQNCESYLPQLHKNLHESDKVISKSEAISYFTKGLNIDNRDSNHQLESWNYAIKLSNIGIIDKADIEESMKLIARIFDIESRVSVSDATSERLIKRSRQA